ncbi:MAG: hypothetical protein A3C35_06810 [Omnitrophica bacterium RIFCSPHIGHO2_02_FULL_46_11]|nr:MAG: hypothetical protein A3C35_06810 [Omnitrophica bacterium RIFCSPHIGHO2_02_FULL_46_11]OGW86743.1 MAG: hypothetical protein A3A81_08715 [Omnitrophica bacterium RIFCSPLOWO2_01_FULL_45_10b]
MKKTRRGFNIFSVPQNDSKNSFQDLPINFVSFSLFTIHYPNSLKIASFMSYNGFSAAND